MCTQTTVVLVIFGVLDNRMHIQDIYVLMFELFGLAKEQVPVESTYRRVDPVSYTHLTLPTIYSV